MQYSKPDTELWIEMKAGDKTALAQLYNRYCKHLYNYGRKICSETGFLEDCIHDLFVAVWETRERLACPDSVKFYLFRSLRRRLVTEGSRSEITIDDTFTWEQTIKLFTVSAESAWIESEKRSEKLEWLQKVLHNLPCRQYEALILRFYEGFEYHQIADIMKVNEQTARNFVQRALLQLKQYAKPFISILLLAAYLLF
jgi:RNA polymerase sigma factor (sigma-70 family)